MVANRNRRYFDCSIAGCNSIKTGFGNTSVIWYSTAIVDGEGNELEGAAEGNLVIKDSWPGQMRTIWGDPDRFIEAYFSTFKNTYLQVMVLAVIKMVITGLQVGLTMS